MNGRVKGYSGMMMVRDQKEGEGRREGRREDLLGVLIVLKLTLVVARFDSTIVGNHEHVCQGL